MDKLIGFTSFFTPMVEIYSIHLNQGITLQNSKNVLIFFTKLTTNGILGPIKTLRFESQKILQKNLNISSPLDNF